MLRNEFVIIAAFLLVFAVVAKAIPPHEHAQNAGSAETVEKPRIKPNSTEAEPAEKPSRRRGPDVDSSAGTKKSAAVLTGRADLDTQLNSPRVDDIVVQDAARSTDETPQRLPTVITPADFDLESPTDWPARLPDVESVAPEQDVVLHAGGAVEFRLPIGWNVAEVSAGREVRLIFSPGDSPSVAGGIRDGGWLTCHVQTVSNWPAIETLERRIDRRIQMATDNRAELHVQRRLTVAGRPAVRREFVIPATSREQAVTGYRGFHLLVRTKWGILEFHAIAPSAEFASRQPDFDAILDELRLHSPRSNDRELVDSVLSAAPIIGTWKSFRGRMKLKPTGQVTMIFEKPQVVAVDEASQGSTEYRRGPEQITGRFDARDDLLIITWDDGSLMNFRWKLHEGELLLTDHTGEISQLRRLLD